MKKAVLLFVLLAASTVVFAQSKNKKLSDYESSKMTPDQRYAHEADRKTKGNKKRLSTKQKVRLEEKTDKKARKMKDPKRRRS